MEDKGLPETFNEDTLVFLSKLSSETLMVINGVLDGEAYWDTTPDVPDNLRSSYNHWITQELSFRVRFKRSQLDVNPALV